MDRGTSGLQSRGLERVGHDYNSLAHVHIQRRRKPILGGMSVPSADLWEDSSQTPECQGPFQTHPRWEDSWRQVLRSVTSGPCSSSDPLSAGSPRLLVTRQSGRPACGEQLSFVCRSPVAAGTGVPASSSSPPSALPPLPSQRVFPYVSAMVNNGSLSYDHERDGRPTELGGCTAIVRNLHYDTFLVIRYVKRHLTVSPRSGRRLSAVRAVSLRCRGSALTCPPPPLCCRS